MTGSRPTDRTRRLAAGCLGALALLATGGCGVAEVVTKEKTEHYDTVADAAEADAESDDLAFDLPDGLLPEDATDITVRVRTDTADRKAYDWASASGALPADCVPGGPPAEVDPFYTSGDWPDEATTASGQRCGGVWVSEVDGHFYAWPAR